MVFLAYFRPYWGRYLKKRAKLRHTFIVVIKKEAQHKKVLLRVAGKHTDTKKGAKAPSR